MAETHEIEAARVRAVAVAMTALVDVRDWSGVERFFAPQVRVDYSSLFPGEAEMLAREALVARWRALVPGFDATRHRLGDVAIEVTGNEATGTANVAGTHWLDGRSWTVTGRYDYAFRKVDGAWRISALTYLSEREEGDRGLVDLAAARAAEQQNER